MAMTIPSDMIYAALERISKASGNQKQTVLAKYENWIEKYLQYAYNPYMRFNLTWPADAAGTGTEAFSYETWQLLDSLNSQVLSGNAAKVAVHQHLAALSPESGKVLVRIINKDLRIGMGAKTINKVFPGLIPVHEVMLAKPYDKGRIKFPCWGSPKIDEVRAVYNNGLFYSRNGKVFKSVPHLEKAIATRLKALQIPDAQVDGGLLVPKKNFDQSSGLLRRTKAVSSAIFCIYDFPEIDTSFTARCELAKKLSDPPLGIRFVPHFLMNSHEDIDAFYEKCLKGNFEGSVIKPLDYKYTRTRSYSWMKLKPTTTEDLLVISTYEGEGKYTGMLGGLICVLNGVQVRVGSGFSDDQRALPRRRWLNKFVEVKAMEKTVAGSLRHPRFIKVREDL